MINAGCTWGATALVVATTLIVFINVVFRYVFNSPLSWRDELSTFMQLWFVLLPQIWLEYSDDQLQLTILVSRIKNVTFHKILKLGRSLIVFVINPYLAFYGLKVVLQNYRLGSKTFILEMPYWIVFMILPVSLMLMVIGRLAALMGEGENGHAS
jgi:C4-dicarboxylate transporter, DctQ subunit